MDAAPEFAFHHVGISVPDLETAARWWEQMFGFKVIKRFRIEPADADVVVLAKGDLNVELFQANGAIPLPDDRRIPIKDIGTHGTKHVAFRIRNLDEFLVAVRAKGADVAVVEGRTGLGPMCFLRDPAGTLIEFVQTT
jgi:catechol 2,3-dioxygenase-like lactoylglutathione lyase family enzyme